MEDRKPSDVLKDSIAALKAISADVDAEQAVADEANVHIIILGTKLQETALDNMVTRTQSLQTLMGALEAVVLKADHNDTSQGVAKVRCLLGEAKTHYETAKGMLGK